MKKEMARAAVHVAQYAYGAAWPYIIAALEEMSEKEASDSPLVHETRKIAHEIERSLSKLMTALRR